MVHFAVDHIIVVVVAHSPQMLRACWSPVGDLERSRTSSAYACAGVEDMERGIESSFSIRESIKMLNRVGLIGSPWGTPIVRRAESGLV